MLFDEPALSLDPETMTEVVELMVGLAQEGMTKMVVTHEMNFAGKVACRIGCMERARIMEDKPACDFFTQPRSARAREFLARILH